MKLDLVPRTSRLSDDEKVVKWSSPRAIWLLSREFRPVTVQTWSLKERYRNMLRKTYCIVSKIRKRTKEEVEKEGEPCPVLLLFFFFLFFWRWCITIVLNFRKNPEFFETRYLIYFQILYFRDHLYPRKINHFISFSACFWISTYNLYLQKMQWYFGCFRELNEWLSEDPIRRKILNHSCISCSLNKIIISNDCKHL